jgi:TolB protein
VPRQQLLDDQEGDAFQSQIGPDSRLELSRRGGTFVIRLYILPCLAIVLAACSPAAHKSEEYKIALVPDMVGQHGIFALNSDGTGGRLLTPDATAQLRPYSWSPDGRKIAFFATRKDDLQILQKYRMPLHFPLYLMDASGGNQRRLLDFPVSSFAWSPDSRHFIYASAYEDPAHDDADVLKRTKAPMSALYLLDLETGKQKRVTGFGQNCYGSWAPDGLRLALSFGDAQGSDIFVASLDGKHTRRISDSPGINIKPVWSPDGKRIAYLSFVSQPNGMMADACIIESDGSNRRQIRDVNPYEVSWSVDGRSLLLQSLNGITLASVNGKIILDLRNKVIQPQDAIFTPDGKGVMFRSNHEGHWYLYIVDLNGANIRRMSGSLSASMFCLSPLSR